MCVIFNFFFPCPSSKSISIAIMPRIWFTSIELDSGSPLHDYRRGCFEDQVTEIASIRFRSRLRSLAVAVSHEASRAEKCTWWQPGTVTNGSGFWMGTATPLNLSNFTSLHTKDPRGANPSSVDVQNQVMWLEAIYSWRFGHVLIPQTLWFKHPKTSLPQSCPVLSVLWRFWFDDFWSWAAPVAQTSLEETSRCLGCVAAS